MVMAKHDLNYQKEDETPKNKPKNGFVDVEMLSDKFPPCKSKRNHKSDKSFSEMVTESTRLPEIDSSLPISMKEILRSTPKQTDWSPRLPSIPQGQVQLVHKSETISNRKEKRRLKRERKSRIQGQRQHESLFSHRMAKDEHSKVSWKKKLHQRQKKRLLEEGESSLTVGREFKLPTLGTGVTKW